MNIETPEQELPPEIQDLIEEMKEAKAAKREEIGKYVGKKRDEAVKGRKASGIETIWEEDAEYYEGVDEANRDSHPWVKSASSTGGISRTPTKSTTRCTSFFNITRSFVDSASARMGDILLPAGDWNFACKPTPVQNIPEDAQLVEQPQVQPQAPPEMAQQGAPQQPPAEPVDQSRQIQMIAEDKAEKAELWIQDKLVECTYHTEVRTVIEDSAKLGTGILKGPYPIKRTSRKAVQAEGKMTLDISVETSPASKAVDCWDAFPDPSCGENIHDGNYFLERDRITARQLKDLKGLDGYLDDQIDKVLEEGPNKKNHADDGAHKQNDDFTKDDDKFEIWYYYGLIDLDALSSLSVSVPEADKNKSTLPAIVTLVNDTAIKAFINPLDTGEFPYDVMPWQRMAGSPWGIGVARQMRTPQDMLNAATRAMMDNAGLSSGPMIIIRKGAILPADGKWEITARKVWYATEQSDVRSVADAFQAINIPMMQEELSAIIQIATKMAEDSTGIAYIMQGQTGSAPDTVGGMELLHRNASAPLRRLARVFDERVTEPHIRRYYEYLLMYGPEECKGDVRIEAIGSTALVEREIQGMESMALLQMSLDPRFGLDPEQAMTEVLKTKRFIPEKWQLSDEKKAALAKQQPAAVPAIEVAKIRSEDNKAQIASQERIAQEHLNRDAELAKIDMDKDTAYQQTMTNKENTNTQLRLQELQIKRDLAMLEYANKRELNLNDIKADLAKESMRLRTQKELAGLAIEENKRVKPKIPVTPQIATPAVEPPQHARDGEAFQQ